MSQPVLHCVFALGQSHDPIHLVLIALQHRHVVSDLQHRRILQLAFGRALKRALGVGEAIEEKIALRKTAVPNDNVGLERDSSSGHLHRSFKSAGPMGGQAP